MDILTFALLGLAIGSFLNVVIIRLPKEESIAFPSSHCVKCNTPLKWYHNIPLFSWIFLKGKCAYCSEKISIQYPLVELLVMFIFIFSYIKSNNFVYGIIIATIFSSLLAMSFIDFKYKVVPDSLNFLALFLAIFASSAIFDNFINMLLFVGAFSLLRLVLTSFKGIEAMGEADIIVAGTIGALLGVKYGSIAIFLSAFIALPVFVIIKEKDLQVPYIPFLAISTFLVYIFKAQVNSFIEFLYG